MARLKTVSALMIGVLFLGASVGAQDPDYVLSAASRTAVITSTVDVPTILDNPAGTELAGWSWGVCHDNSNIEILSVVDGVTVATVNGGSPPDFGAAAVFPGEGWTVGVVINFFGTFVLPPGTGSEMHVATYSADAEGSTELCFCDTLGSPNVPVTLVAADGTSIPPVAVCGTVTVELGPPPFKLTAPSGSLSYSPDDGIGSFTGSVDLEENPENPNFPSDTSGMSIGLSHDPILIAVSVEPAPVLQAMDGGAGPSFFGPNVNPQNGPGITVGIVYSFLGLEFLQFTTPAAVIVVTYDSDPTPLIGDMDGETAPLSFSDSLGSPPVTNTVVVDSSGQGVEFEDGVVNLIPFIPTPFVRGDCNGDGGVDIGDAIWLLNNLFQGGPDSACQASCNSNGDGTVDQSDAVYVLNYFFLNGASPPAPFPGCDVSPEEECVTYVNCP